MESNGMSPEFWIAIIGQTVVIVVTVVAAFIRTERRITKVETKIEHIEVEIERIPGLSRAVARIQGQVCRNGD